MNSSGEYFAPGSAFLRRVGCSGRHSCTAPGNHSCERNRSHTETTPERSSAASASHGSARRSPSQRLLAKILTTRFTHRFPVGAEFLSARRGASLSAAGSSDPRHSEGQGLRRTSAAAPAASAAAQFGPEPTATAGRRPVARPVQSPGAAKSARNRGCSSARTPAIGKPRAESLKGSTPQPRLNVVHGGKAVTLARGPELRVRERSGRAVGGEGPGDPRSRLRGGDLLGRTGRRGGHLGRRRRRGGRAVDAEGESHSYRQERHGLFVTFASA